MLFSTLENIFVKVLTIHLITFLWSAAEYLRIIPAYRTVRPFFDADISEFHFQSVEDHQPVCQKVSFVDSE